MSDCNFPLRSIILAGGQGSRLRAEARSGMSRELATIDVRLLEHLRTTPKVLLPLPDLEGAPLLIHKLHGLALQGVRDFVVITGFGSERVEAALAKYPLPECNVRTSSPENGSVFLHILDLVRAQSQGQSVHISNGDSLSAVSIPLIMSEHLDRGDAVSVAVQPWGFCAFTGDAIISPSALDRFKERVCEFAQRECFDEQFYGFLKACGERVTGAAFTNINEVSDYLKLIADFRTGRALYPLYSGSLLRLPAIEELPTEPIRSVEQVQTREISR